MKKQKKIRVCLARQIRKTYGLGFVESFKMAKAYLKDDSETLYRMGCDTNHVYWEFKGHIMALLKTY